jgi:hypothetical protein
MATGQFDGGGSAVLCGRGAQLISSDSNDDLGMFLMSIGIAIYHR